MKKCSQRKRKDKFRKFKRLCLLDALIDENTIFLSIDEFLNGIDRFLSYFIYYDRVSKDEQKDAMKRRKEVIKKEVELKAKEYGIRVVFAKKEFLESCKGYSDYLEERKSLKKAACCYRKYKRRNRIVAILTPCVNRIIRPNYFIWKKNRNSKLFESDISLLKSVTGDLIVVTFIVPGTGNKRQESILGTLGQKKSNKKLGRKKKWKPGIKKIIYETYYPLVKKLRKRRRTYKAIHEIINRKVKERFKESVGLTTIKDWVNKTQKRKK